MKNTLTLIFLFYSIIGSAQNTLVRQWDYKYGGQGTDDVYALQKTPAGGYLIGGLSASGMDGDKSQTSRGGDDYYIVLLDSLGRKQWDRRFGGDLNDDLSCMVQTTDGGYLLGGNSWSTASGDKTQPRWGSALSERSDYWIVKTDAAGNKEWDRRFGSTMDDFLTCMQQTSDGGYIIGGYTFSLAGGNKTQTNWDPSGQTTDIWIVKIDSAGNLQWEHTYGGTQHDKIWSIKQVSDGGYFLGATSGSGISGDKTVSNWSGADDIWLLKIDSGGTKQWDRRYGGTKYEYLCDIVFTPDGGYILAGSSESGITGNKSQPNWDSTNYTSDYWMIKLDTGGVKQWDKRFGAPATDRLGSIFPTVDGGYLLSGYSRYGAGGDRSENCFAGNGQGWIVKTDSIGNMDWEKTILQAAGSSILTNAFSFGVEASDGSFVISNGHPTGAGGYRTQPNWYPSYPYPDFWIVNFCDSATAVARFRVDLSSTSSSCTGPCSGTAIVVPRYGIPPYQIHWSNNSINDSLQNLCAGVYTVTVTDAVNNTVSASATITPPLCGCSSFSNTICSGQSYFFNNQNLTTGGTYYDTITVSVGCDSFIILHLTVLPVIASSFNASVCNGHSYFFNGQNLTAPGNYNDTLLSVTGCDSIITLHLSLNAASAGSVNAGICSGSFYSFNGQSLSNAGNYNDTLVNVNGCDSILTLHLTVYPAPNSVVSAAICEGEIFGFNGQDLTMAGNYSDTFLTVHGCDSIVTLQLTVNPLPVLTFNLPDTVCLNTNSILLNGTPAGGLYSAAAGVINDSFYPTGNAGENLIVYEYQDGNGCYNITADSTFVTLCPDSGCYAFYTIYPDTVLLHNWWAVNQAYGHGAVTYTWYWGDGTSDTGSAPTHTYSAAGNYNICLTVSDSAGCSDTYCDSNTYIYKTEDMITIRVVYEIPTVIGSLKMPSFRIYPNPASTYINLELDERMVGSQLSLCSITGQVIKSTRLVTQNNILSVDDLPSGVYVVILKNNNGSFAKRWVKL